MFICLCLRLCMYLYISVFTRLSSALMDVRFWYVWKVISHRCTWVERLGFGQLDRWAIHYKQEQEAEGFPLVAEAPILQTHGAQYPRPLNPKPQCFKVMSVDRFLDYVLGFRCRALLISKVLAVDGDGLLFVCIQYVLLRTARPGRGNPAQKLNLT